MVEESRVFSTKCRSPFYLCIEVYRPEEEAEMVNETDRSKIEEFNKKLDYD